MVYNKYIKRVLDIIIGLAVMLLLWPIMLLVIVAIIIESPGAPVFKQERIGRYGRTFRIYKFRSMCKNAEHTGMGVYSDSTDERVTRVGKFIRKTSIDELPQFLNILKGDMSLIGPRPPLLYHPWKLEEYTDEERRMFDVRPGITGWAQVNGRRQVEWHERIKLNVYYVDHVSFLLDVKIFFLTIYKVLISENNENVRKTVS